MKNNSFLKAMLPRSDFSPTGLPNGVLFLAGEEITKLEKLYGSITGVFERSGYKRVVPPVFEYYETFEKGGGDDIARQSFSFKDNEGRLLSLRSDMTTPIARMAAMRYGEGDLPLKFYYSGDVYREQPLYKGRLRQINQMGIELIGESGVESDARVLSILCDVLEMLDPGYRLVAGDVRIYDNAIKSLGVPEAFKGAMHAAINNKDITSLKLLTDELDGDESLKDLLLKLPGITGPADNVEKSLKGFDIDIPAIFGNELFGAIRMLPEKTREHIIVDLSLIRDFSYYSSLTLEGYVNSSQYAVAGGGRYDSLFSSFGRDFPAIGFAIDMSFCL